MLWREINSPEGEKQKIEVNTNIFSSNLYEQQDERKNPTSVTLHLSSSKRDGYHLKQMNMIKEQASTEIDLDRHWISLEGKKNEDITIFE